MLLTLLNEFRTSKNSKTRKLKMLYRLILNHGPVRAEELSSLASMKPATCARLLDELSKSQLISTSELGESTGGRKPILYSINSDDGYVVGIEMSDLYSTIMLLNLKLDILGMLKIKNEQLETAENMLDHLLIKVEQLLSEHQLTIEKILGIGIAIDHILERDKVDFTKYDERISSLFNYIDNKVPCFVTLGSGITFAALAEYRLRYHSKSQRFLFTTCDTDIRSCTIINNTFAPAPISTAQAFGHTTIDIRGLRCECGSYGCLKQYSSLSAIKARIIQQIRLGKSSIINQLVITESEINYHTIFQALAMDDKLCLEVLEEAAYYYGLAIANAILTLQPDVVVCGGTLTPKNHFFAMTKKSIEAKMAAFPHIKTRIFPANDSYEVVAQGAGGMVLENYLAD
ncbi:ROK family protein [Providencia stuartii]|uniref:ROK family protein n=1 Tax=Providencia stuartii TaxID=588 RepID=UPI00201E401A|nr:ROK family protein [Providencia stuartii]MCX3070537.1 ROK family protein [Providencia stuartii]MDT2016554.1 ROK family protein [Providencia stuartii]MDT2082200.1 ROK family protein [Providencia stuartii]UQZ11987.1 ROK family protein [Providencia stuartii]